MDGMVSFSILGPVEIVVAGQALPLGRRSCGTSWPRCCCTPAGAVSPARLTEALWDHEPPSSARKNLHQYVHRLRGLLAPYGGPDRLGSGPGGYLLRVYPGELDLDRFEALAAAGRHARTPASGSHRAVTDEGFGALAW